MELETRRNPSLGRRKIVWGLPWARPACSSNLGSSIEEFPHTQGTVRGTVILVEGVQIWMFVCSKFQITMERNCDEDGDDGECHFSWQIFW